MNDKVDLEEKAAKCLRNKRLIGETRARIGQDALNPSRLAHWRRVGFPTLFLEGFTLSECANMDTHTGAKRNRVAAERLFQVFAVDEPPPNPSGNLDCLGVRLWQGVQANQYDRKAYLRVRTWFDGDFPTDLNDKRWPRDLITNQRIGRKEEDIEKNGCILTIDKASNAHSAILTWEIPPDQQTEYGFSLEMSRTISPYRNHHPYDFLGGTPAIPTRSLVTLVILPSEILEQGGSLLDREPQFFGVSMEGDFLKTVDQFLSKKLLPREEDYLIDRQGPVRLWHDTDIRLPKRIEEEFIAAGVITEDEVRARLKRKHVIYVAEAAEPEVHRNYCLCFRLRDKPKPTGDIVDA